VGSGCREYHTLVADDDDEMTMLMHHDGAVLYDDVMSEKSAGMAGTRVVRHWVMAAWMGWMTCRRDADTVACVA